MSKTFWLTHSLITKCHWTDCNEICNMLIRETSRWVSQNWNNKNTQYIYIYIFLFALFFGNLCASPLRSSTHSSELTFEWFKSSRHKTNSWNILSTFIFLYIWWRIWFSLSTSIAHEIVTALYRIDFTKPIIDTLYAWF